MTYEQIKRLLDVFNFMTKVLQYLRFLLHKIPEVVCINFFVFFPWTHFEGMTFSFSSHFASLLYSRCRQEQQRKNAKTTNIIKKMVRPKRNTTI